MIMEPRALQAHIYDFYRALMGSEGDRPLLTLSPSLWDTRPRVSEDENDSLMLSFTEKELDVVLASMKVDMAPGQIACRSASSRSSGLSLDCTS